MSLHGSTTTPQLDQPLSQRPGGSRSAISLWGSTTTPLSDQPSSQRPGCSRSTVSLQGSTTTPLSDQRPGCSRSTVSLQGSTTTPLSDQQPSQQPGCSRSQSQLRELFPNLTDWQVSEISSSYPDLQEAASFAAEISEKNESKADKTLETLEDVFIYFENKFDSATQILRVHDKDIYSGVLSLYKDKSFDPLKKLRVIIENGPGIDAGGLTRHAFDTVFLTLRKSGHSRLFEGNRYSLLPICTASTALSQIFVFIGKIIGHALLHGIRVIQIPTVAYYYIITQDITHCLQYLDADDVSCEAIKYYVDEISDADERKLKELAENAELLQYIEESGERCTLTKETKQLVLQSLIVYDVLIKRRTSYEHIRKGLEIVGVLKTLQLYKDLCKPLLTYDARYDDVNPESMLRNITCSSQNLSHGPLLSKVIRRMSNKELKQLLKYATASDNLNVLKDQNLYVRVVPDAAGFFSSTCSMELTVPEALFENEEMLLNAFKSVIIPGEQSFNAS
ncbi:uncharacterized protein [Clytia hemisphaerica]|uniref:HECT domain-containing protein n=2 Tax=Clytia hemisphaerica TaxID=252671 RepID=A0A7M5X397_9CNID